MPIDRDAVRCKWCHVLILWTVTAAGKRMAVNAEADPTGNTAVYRTAAGTLRSRAITAKRPGPNHLERCMRPHAAVCSRPKRRPAASQP